MQKPLISIITITFNAAATVPPTMASVATQSFRDFEHIVIDGASSDDTLSRLRDYPSTDLRILSEKDNGIYDAMNKGLKMARGEYVIFLNAGDSFASEFSLADYAKAIAVHKPDIIYADTVIVNDRREVLRPRHLSVPESLTFQSFSNGMLVCHQAFMVRRDLAPAYNTDYRFSADYDWTIRCIKATLPERCFNLHTVEIHYLDDGATEKNKIASLKERFEIMRHHYGLATAMMRHASFIPRALARRFAKS